MSRLKLPTLLAVTDNPSIRYWIKKHLDAEFFIIDASKKKNAIEAAQTSALDFIIIDSEFEECDVLELCAEMKQILRTLVPILMITGRLKRSFLDAASEAGVTDFLSNQLDPAELETKIQAIRKTHSVREKTQEVSIALPKPREEFPTSDYLKNKVRIHNQTVKAMKEAKKEGAAFISLIIHIDHFDQIQDKEQVHLHCSNLIKNSLSKTDLLVSSTVGHFIVLLKNETPENALALAERLRKVVHHAPSPVPLTLSIAISSTIGTETDLKKTVNASEKALKTASDIIISIDKETP